MGIVIKNSNKIFVDKGNKTKTGPMKTNTRWILRILKINNK